MSFATCLDCRQLFDPRADWQTRCYPCFKRYRAKQEGENFDEYRHCTDCGAGFVANASWQARCLACHNSRKAGQAVDLRAERDRALDLVRTLRRELDQTRLALASRPVERVIPFDQWRRLLQLCHPDRHNNSDTI